MINILLYNSKFIPDMSKFKVIYNEVGIALVTHTIFRQSSSCIGKSEYIKYLDLKDSYEFLLCTYIKEISIANHYSYYRYDFKIL